MRGIYLSLTKKKIDEIKTSFGGESYSAEILFVSRKTWVILPFDWAIAVWGARRRAMTNERPKAIGVRRRSLGFMVNCEVNRLVCGCGGEVLAEGDNASYNR